MATHKLYAGVKLRDIRTQLALTQKAFAAKLGVSLPYLNQMENNHRPVSTGVVLALAGEFGFDVTQFSTGEAERVVADMREALADPVFADDPPPLADLRLAASNAPALARAFLHLHRSYRQTHERLASLDEALGRDGVRVQQNPWEEVRDFFHYCDNYIDAVDRAAERFAQNGDAAGRAVDTLRARGIDTVTADSDLLRSFDPVAGRLTLSARATPASRAFQLLHQLALLTQNDLIEATLDLARLQSAEARAIAKLGLANYFAGAALLPYGAFLKAAIETRHDLERLSDQFGASIEQVAHRLSTLQRPGAKGVPFFSCGSIRRGRSRNAIPPPSCNSPASAVPVRCGMYTAPLKHRAGSCGNWRKRLTGCAISASRATSANRGAASTRRRAALPSALGAR